MGGLQGNLIDRSKRVNGTATIFFTPKSKSSDQIIAYLENKNIAYSIELESEVLLRNGARMAPAIIRGIDFDHYTPSFLTNVNKQALILGNDLAYKINAGISIELDILTPLQTVGLLEEYPRVLTLTISDVVQTLVPEVDGVSVYASINKVKNILGTHHFNRIKIYDSSLSSSQLKQIKHFLDKNSWIKMWEQENEALVWSLKLETTVMIILFAAMTMLVSVTITSGLLIFFNKVQSDLTGLWILGMSKKSIFRHSAIFIHLLSFLTISLGLLSALGILKYLDLFAPELMPDIFVERSLPVKITLQGVCISFFIPYIISATFAHFSLKQFQKDEKAFLAHIRSTGH